MNMETEQLQHPGDVVSLGHFQVTLQHPSMTEGRGSATLPETQKEYENDISTS